MCYLLAIIALTDNPRGKYASYEMVPHAWTDVLRFQDGKVTLETCCGDGNVRDLHSGRLRSVDMGASISEAACGPHEVAFDASTEIHALPLAL